MDNYTGTWIVSHWALLGIIISGYASMLFTAPITVRWATQGQGWRERVPALPVMTSFAAGHIALCVLVLHA